jgi:hypothetical protein
MLRTPKAPWIGITLDGQLLFEIEMQCIPVIELVSVISRGVPVNGITGR